MKCLEKRKAGILLPCAVLVTAASCSVLKPEADTAIKYPSHFTRNDTVQHNGRLFSEKLLFTERELYVLIDSAVRNSPDVLSANHRIEVARSYWRFRKGALLPFIAAEAAASAQKYGDYTIEGVGNFDTNLSPNISNDQKVDLPLVPYYFLGLKSSWEIDLWGKLKKRKQAAYRRLMASEQGRRLVITSLVAEIASRYYELKSLDARLEVIDRNIRLQDSAVRIAEVQKEAGRTTSLGIQQFNAQLLRTRSIYEQTRQEIVRVENEINFLAGRFPQTVNRKRDFALQTISSGYLAGLPQQILNNRPDIKQTELEMKAADADIYAARAALLPAVTISTFAGFSSFNGPLLFNPASIAYGLIGGLAGPLVNRTEVKAEISRSEAEKQIAYQLYFKTVIKAFKEVETTLSDIFFLSRIHELNAKEAEVLLSAVNTSDELYKAGYASYLEVITAQRNALDAQINSIDTKMKMYEAVVTLYRATGGGWAEN